MIGSLKKYLLIYLISFFISSLSINFIFYFTYFYGSLRNNISNIINYFLKIILNNFCLNLFFASINGINMICVFFS